MMSRATLVLALTILSGCTEQVAACPTADELFDGERCVPRAAMDGGVSDGGDAGEDGGPDGGPDAGPCGDTCGTDEVCRDDDGTCVECAESAHCPPERPMCDNFACVTGCDVTTCARYPMTPRCENLSGSCVACLPESEETDCGAKSCHPTDFVCTTTDRDSLGRCAPCASSSECGLFDTGSSMLRMGCALTEWVGGAAGQYCVVDYGATGRSITCPAGTPRVADGLEVAGGPDSDFCVPVRETTCAAITDDDGCSVDDECGAPGLDDAACYMGACESLCNATAGDRGCPGTQSCTDEVTRRVCTG